MTAVTCEDLRRELREFAHDVFSYELETMSARLLQSLKVELQGLSCAAYPPLAVYDLDNFDKAGCIEAINTDSRDSSGRSECKNTVEFGEKTSFHNGMGKMSVVSPESDSKKTSLLPAARVTRKTMPPGQRQSLAAPRHSEEQAEDPDGLSYLTKHHGFYVGSKTWETKDKRVANVSSVTSAQLFLLDVHDFFRWLVESTLLDAVSAFCIFLNAVLLGIVTEAMSEAAKNDEPQWYQTTEKFFCVFFTVELSIRLVVFRSSFFYGDGMWWNLFDCALVVAQLFEEMFKLVVHGVSTDASQFEKVEVIRIARVMRMIRILRVMRVLHLIKELRCIVVAILSSMRSLAWTIVLLVLLMYSLAVWLTTMVTNLRDVDDATDMSVYLFSSLSRGVLTLFQSITGGMDWNEVCEPLMQDLGPYIALVMCGFVSFVIFALMNVVTGVFVDGALRSTKLDQEVCIVHHLKQILVLADTDNDGNISWEEFTAQLHSEEFRRLFEFLEMDPEDAEDLFHLIDADESGEISADELIHGCLRLRGPAKAIDFQAFMQIYRHTTVRHNTHAKKVENVLAMLAHQVSAIAAKRSGGVVTKIMEADFSAPNDHDQKCDLTCDQTVADEGLVFTEGEVLLSPGSRKKRDDASEVIEEDEVKEEVV